MVAMRTRSRAARSVANVVALALVASTLGVSLAVGATVADPEPARADTLVVDALVMLCQYENDNPFLFNPLPDSLYRMFEGGFPSAEDYFEEITQNAVDYDFDLANDEYDDEDWKTLPSPEDDYDDTQHIEDECRGIWAPADDYDLYITIVDGGAPGPSNAGGDEAFIKLSGGFGGWQHLSTITHELAHAYPFHLQHEYFADDPYRDKFHGVSEIDSDDLEEWSYDFEFGDGADGVVPPHTIRCDGECLVGESKIPVYMSATQIAGRGPDAEVHPLFPQFAKRFDMYGGKHKVILDSFQHVTDGDAPEFLTHWMVLRAFSPDGRWQYTVEARQEEDESDDNGDDDDEYEDSLPETGVVIHRSDLTVGADAQNATVLLPPNGQPERAWQPGDTFDDPLTGFSLEVVDEFTTEHVVLATFNTPTPTILGVGTTADSIGTAPVATLFADTNPNDTDEPNVIFLKTKGFVDTAQGLAGWLGTSVPMTRFNIQPFFDIVSRDHATGEQVVRAELFEDSVGVQLFGYRAQNEQVNRGHLQGFVPGNTFKSWIVSRDVDVSSFGTNAAGSNTVDLDNRIKIETVNVGAPDVRVSRFSARPTEAAAEVPDLGSWFGVELASSTGSIADDEIVVSACNEQQFEAELRYWQPGPDRWVPLPTTYDPGTKCNTTLVRFGDLAYSRIVAGAAFGLFGSAVSVTVDATQPYGGPMAFTVTPDAAFPANVTLTGTAYCDLGQDNPTSIVRSVGTHAIDGGTCSGLSLAGANAGRYALKINGGTLIVGQGFLDVLVSGSQSGGGASNLTWAPAVGYSTTANGTYFAPAGTLACTQLVGGQAISPSLPVGAFTVAPASCSGLDTQELRQSDGVVVGPYTNREVRYVGVPGGYAVGTPFDVTVRGTGSLGGAVTWAATPVSPPAGLTLTGTPTCTTLATGDAISASTPAGGHAVDPVSCTGLGLTGAGAAGAFVRITSATLVLDRGTYIVNVGGKHVFGETPTFAFEEVPYEFLGLPRPVDVSVTGTPVCTTTRPNAIHPSLPIDSSLPIGFYSIEDASCSGLTLTGALASSYDLVITGAAYNVLHKPAVVTINGSMVYQGARSFTVDKSALPAGVTVTGQVHCSETDHPNAGLSNLPVGTSTIVASSCTGLFANHPSGEYLIKYVGGTFTVTPRPINVTITGAQTFGGSPTWTAAVTSPTGTTIVADPICTTLVGGGAIDGTVPAGEYEVDRSSCTGITMSGPTSPNYTIRISDADLTVEAIEIPVTATATQVYGGTVEWGHEEDLPSGITLSGSVTCPDVVDETPNAGDVLAVGTYDLDPASCSGLSPSGTDAGGYVVTYAAAGLEVASAALTITASSATLTYGDPAPTITPSYAGFVNGEDVSVLATAPTCSSPVGPTTSAGTYASTCGGAAAANYAISYVDGSVEVGKKQLVVQANDVTRPYGQPNPTFGFTATGLVNGEGPEVLTGAPMFFTTADPTSLPGTYPILITQGGLGSANYSFAFQAGTLTVVKAPVTLSAQDVSVARGLLLSMLSFKAKAVNGSGAPISGLPIVFVANTLTGTVTCNGTTNANGEASCKVSVLGVLLSGLTSGGYKALFLGDARYLPEDADGGITIL